MEAVGGGDYNKKQKRYQAYRHAANILEYGPRAKLPWCIEHKIKCAFPEDKSAAYVGYKVGVEEVHGLCISSSVSVSDPLSFSNAASTFTARSSHVVYVYAPERRACLCSRRVLRAFFSAFFCLPSSVAQRSRAPTLAASHRPRTWTVFSLTSRSANSSEILRCSGSVPPRLCSRTATSTRAV